MAIVVESTSTANASATGLTITKPAGLAVGDLLISAVSSMDAVEQTINLNSGWTNAVNASIVGATGLSYMSSRIQAKIADAADVAASDFTFSSAGTSIKAGVLLRVSGIRPASFVGTVSSNSTADTSQTAVSFNPSVTPAVDGSLLIMMFHSFVVGTGSAGSISGYSSTPTLTWTEVLDYGVDSGANDPITGVAYAIQTTAAQITDQSATLSHNRRTHVGLFASFYPIVNATGTNATFAVSPVIFSGNGSAGTTGTNATFAVSPNIPTQNGDTSVSTVWTPITKS